MEKSNISAWLSVSLCLLAKEFGLESLGASDHAFKKKLNTIGKVYRLVTFRRGANPNIVIFIAFTLFVVIFLGDGFDNKLSSQPLSNSHLIRYFHPEARMD